MSSASPPSRTRQRSLDADDRSRSHLSSSNNNNKDRASPPSSSRQRSPDPRSKHTHSRRSVSPDDKERSWRRREHRHRRERSRDHDRDRDRRRRHRSRSRSRDEDSRRRQRDERHSRRSQQGRSRERERERDTKRRKPALSPPPPASAARSKAPLPSQDAAYRSTDNADSSGALDKPIEKQAPNYAQTGLLAKETNTVAGTSIVLKYHEPPDARKPPAKDAWRLYVFKASDVLATHELSGRSCWLFGRESLIADVLLEHPSASKQHAALQFRHTVRVSEFGDRVQKVRPYLIDLESSNGSFLNGERVEGGRYVEVRTGDVLKFGDSTREYVVMLPPPG